MNRIYTCAVAALLLGRIAATAQEVAEAPPANEPAAPVVDDIVEEETQRVEFGEGRLAMQAPVAWKKVEPRSRIIEAEFAIEPPEAKPPVVDPATPPVAPPTTPPAAEPGRLTITVSGGTIEDNMQRWMGQFRLGRDADGEDAFERTKATIGKLTVHSVDIRGTFFDSPQGPFGPKVERPDYRMLGAMIETPDIGTWYLKFYGPEPLVTEHAEAFGRMVESLEYVATAGDETK